MYLIGRKMVLGGLHYRLAIGPGLGGGGASPTPRTRFNAAVKVNEGACSAGAGQRDPRLTGGKRSSG